MPPQNRPALPQDATPQPGDPCPLPGHREDPEWSHFWPSAGPVEGVPVPRECRGTVPPDHGSAVRRYADPAAGDGSRRGRVDPAVGAAAQLPTVRPRGERGPGARRG